MTKYVFDFTEGDKDQKDLLGGKGANLAEMTKLGLPVPPGFTITTEACREYLSQGSEPSELRVQVTMALRQLEDNIGRRLGDRHDPLLVSVRSGAAFSMPGMMETVLNIGLNDASVKGLAEESGDERFAWDSYRRLVQMFGKTVLEMPGEVFSDALDKAKSTKGVSSDVDLDVDDLKSLVTMFKDAVREHSGQDFPQHPREQLDMAINAVFNSWNTERARLYRRRERIPQHLGTAVNVCTMVFGNLGESSGTGVAFTRDPASGRPGAYGDYLSNAQGEDVVAGIRNTLSLDDLKALDASSHKQLMKVMRRLETHYRDLCDIEFTIERGKLWMLQTRVGKRTAAAAFRIAGQLVDENLITMDEALSRVSGSQLALLMFPQFDRSAPRELLTTGMAASPGAAVGRAVFDSPTAKAWAERGGKRVVLVRKETNPDDLEGMIAADGILTARGGKTSHAAVVARGMGKTCVCGAEALEVDASTRTARVGTVLINEGDEISIDGSTGEIFLGAVPVVPSPVETYIESGLAVALEGADDETTALVTAVDRLLTHADARRRLAIRANADTAEDAARARSLGAQGIGLCRTEHMFLGDRRVLIERVILAGTMEERDDALAGLLALQRQDKWMMETFGSWLMPKQRPMDNMAAGWDRPQEDEFALLTLGAPTPYLRMAFPNDPPPYCEFFDMQGCSADGPARFERAIVHFVKLLTFAQQQAGAAQIAAAHGPRSKCWPGCFPARSSFTSCAIRLRCFPRRCGCGNRSTRCRACRCRAGRGWTSTSSIA